jgi:diadenosine tetraphosphatase ApaH/serine/threonine PP2A family protein phosphatase
MLRLIVSDIHSNLEALEAVLRDAAGCYDEIVCCGDLTGYGASPGEVIAWAREEVAVTVRGNHDRAVYDDSALSFFQADAAAAVRWTRSILSAGEVDWLRALPQGPLWRDGYGVAHGSPQDEDEYLAFNEDVEQIDRALMRPLCFIGHTHVQGGWIWERGGMLRPPVPGPGAKSRSMEIDPGYLYLINPGSVGQPRDRDPRAAYALWDDEDRLLSFRRVAYDLRSAQSRMLAEGLPEPLAERLSFGR